ncbi:uncharacterized protein KQ657_002133 [Scheffersomyces spartinae]|uniref:Uncharacterized protein n=1 Tax=Scheffersomyces spartinae TaxID=45513 RepID=A0A9P8AJS8_9ASCO|nr:uncharacterized protein KQ657_002133 [Scheffersomyces spartinae]KAG7195750.1 hypothetical protein KQ657_002133 [Scheffersomyces spartinae]
MSELQCSVFEGTSVANFIFLIAITGGIVVSYIPQYIRIWNRRSSEGLSTNFLLLGSSSSLFTLTNIILVSSKARHCCFIGALSVFNCLNSLISLFQIGTQSVCAVLILVFVLIWTGNSVLQDKHEYSRIVKVGYFVLIHAIVSIIQVFVGLMFGGKVLLRLAQLNGLMSTLLTFIKYVPQIHTTYKLKHPGTLSIGMMCIQTPGGAIFTATLYFSKGSHWSSWISYFFAFLLQGTLLSLCIYYQYFKYHGELADQLEREAIDRIVYENTTTSEASEPLLQESES